MSATGVWQLELGVFIWCTNMTRSEAGKEGPGHTQNNNILFLKTPILSKIWLTTMPLTYHSLDSIKVDTMKHLECKTLSFWCMFWVIIKHGYKSLDTEVELLFIMSVYYNININRQARHYASFHQVCMWSDIYPPLNAKENHRWPQQMVIASLI